MLSDDEIDSGFWESGPSQQEQEQELRKKYPVLLEAYNTHLDAESKYKMLLKIFKSQGNSV